MSILPRHRKLIPGDPVITLAGLPGRIIGVEVDGRLIVECQGRRMFATPDRLTLDPTRWDEKPRTHVPAIAPFWRDKK